MPRPFSPLNDFTRQVRLRALGVDGVVGPLSSSTGVTGSVVGSTTMDGAADAALAAPAWTGTFTYLNTYTDDDGLIWGVYQLVIDAAAITVALCDAAFPRGTDPYFVVHLAGAVHATERLKYRRTRLATLA